MSLPLLMSLVAGIEKVANKPEQLEKMHVKMPTDSAELVLESEKMGVNRLCCVDSTNGQNT